MEVIPLRILGRQVQRVPRSSMVLAVTWTIHAGEKTALPVLDAIRRGASRPSSIMIFMLRSISRQNNIFLMVKPLSQTYTHMQYDPYFGKEASIRAEKTQLSYRGRYWMEWRPVVDRQQDDEMRTDTSLGSACWNVVSRLSYHLPAGRTYCISYHAEYGVGIPNESSIPGVSIGTHQATLCITEVALCQSRDCHGTTTSG